MITTELRTLAFRVILTMGLALAACSAPLAPENAGSLTPAPTGPAPASPPPLATGSAVTAATINVTRTVATRPAISSSDAITLTLWVAEDLAPVASQAAKNLRTQTDSFTAANPNIHIEVVLKKAYGKGGLLDFLTTTRAVLPARLPDLVTLDISEVPQAEAGMLQPLDGLLPGELYNDLFPFAALAARDGNRWIAVPFAANVEHLVYNRALVRKVPQTWDDFLKQKGTLLLPLGGDDGFLVQYLALGAGLVDAQGQRSLDQNATAQVLNWLKRAHDAGLIPESALGLKTVDDVWSSFAAGQVGMAQVSSSRYLAERSKVPNAVYAAVPTREGKLASLATAWSFAMVTNDPTRGAAAARFLQWMMQGEHLAPWLKPNRLLPANRSGVLLAADPPEYASFLRDELEHAVSMPPAASYSRQADAWRNAIAVVWKGQATPEEAARIAVGVK